MSEGVGGEGNKHTAGLAGPADPDGCHDGGQTLRRVQADRDGRAGRPRLVDALRDHPDDLGAVLQAWVGADHRCVHIDRWVAAHPQEVAVLFDALGEIAGGKRFVLRPTTGRFSVDRGPVVKVQIPELGSG